jgi:hypothetical protein
MKKANRYPASSGANVVEEMRMKRFALKLHRLGDEGE